MMKRKRGWILIVEAVLAVLILFGFLFTAIGKQAQQTKPADKGEYLYSVVNDLAIKVENDDMIRMYVLEGEGNEEEINNILEGMTNENVTSCISFVDETCQPNQFNLEKEEIYSAEIIIATNSTSYKVKKLKIFIWEK